MDKTLFQTIPLWLIFVATVGFILLAVETGFRAGVLHARKSEDAREASIDPLMGSTLGLLAFLLAFTFGMATSRYDARRQLVVDDAVAIGTVSLRAQQLPEPHRNDMRALLREYVDVRINAALGQEPLPRALLRTDEIQDELWARAVTLGQEAPAIPSAAAFGQALIQMFEVHTKRVAAGLHNSIPTTIWLALYSLAALALAITGYRAGLSGRRSLTVTVVLALAFAAVFHLIADLDRPDEGYLTVSQQALSDLQTRLHRK
jgi:hypothetical protein